CALWPAVATSPVLPAFRIHIDRVSWATSPGRSANKMMTTSVGHVGVAHADRYHALDSLGPGSRARARRRPPEHQRRLLGWLDRGELALRREHPGWIARVGRSRCLSP